MSKKTDKRKNKKEKVTEKVTEKEVQDVTDDVGEKSFEEGSKNEADILIEKLKAENEALKEEVEKHKNEYFKAYADAENLRKRIERDHELAMKYRIQSFALAILPALDNLERALNQEVNEENNAYRDGVKMIYDQIMNALKNEGVVPIEAVGKEFDPNIHQALMMEEKEGVKPNMIIEELQKGYMIKDRVLRASLVKVSQ